jgi:hypothetical protein
VQELEYLRFQLAQIGLALFQLPPEPPILARDWAGTAALSTAASTAAKMRELNGILAVPACAFQSSKSYEL